MVTNSSQVAAKFDIYATDAFNTSTGAFDLLPAAKKPVDIGSWVQFPANTIEMSDSDMPLCRNWPRPSPSSGEVAISSAAISERQENAQHQPRGRQRGPVELPCQVKREPPVPTSR